MQVIYLKIETDLFYAVIHDLPESWDHSGAKMQDK